MPKEFINPPGLHKPPTYSQVVKAGNTVYAAGQTAVDENGKVVSGDFEAQAVQVFENVRQALEAAGASMKDVVKMTTYLTDVANRPKYGEVRTRYFSPPLPASTLVGISALASPDYLIEVDVTAVIDD
ncbi:MAG: RidA family protein [Chloroflexi bacterium]|nr:RidA family protein [Chloroflexota bacterium]